MSRETRWLERIAPEAELSRQGWGNTPTAAPALVHTVSEQHRLDLPMHRHETTPLVHDYIDQLTTNANTFATSFIHHTHAHLGKQSTNTHRCEDAQGNTLFTFDAIRQRQGNQWLNVAYLHDQNGDVMWNSNGLKADYRYMTLSCRVPGQEHQYFLFTVGTDQIPYIHLIDLSVQGYTMGAVLIKNIALDANAGYDRAMAVIDDRTNYGHAMLYMRRYSAGHYYLMSLDLETFTHNGGGQLALVADNPGSAWGRNSLLQVSPNGSKLAMVTSTGNGYGMNGFATARIHLFNLSNDYTQATVGPVTSVPNAKIRNLDFSANSDHVYYVKTGLIFGGANSHLMRYSISTNTTDNIVTAGGDVRRRRCFGTNPGVEMLLASNDRTVYRIAGIDDATPTATASQVPDIGTLQQAISLQPLIIDLLAPVASRDLELKRYELTDHLGNVRSVITDHKLCNFSNLPAQPTAYFANVTDRTDFYPFGMISDHSPSPDGYRFGFNGKEKDDEVHGATGTSVDFGARMYDPRVGRWMTTDPQAGRGPGISPYAFCDNSPLLYADPTGEWKEIKTTRFYQGADGQLIAKTSVWDIFRKTVKIQRDIIIHDAKLYTDFDGPGTKEVAEQKAFYIMDNIISTWGGSHKDPDHPNSPEVEINISFAEGLQVVSSLDQVNTKGSKSDDLFIWTKDAGIVQAYGGDDANSVAVDPSMVIFGPSGLSNDFYHPNIPGHEFGHEGLLPDNPKGEEMKNDRRITGVPSYQEARGLFNGADGVQKGVTKGLIRGFQKTTEQQEKKEGQ